MHVLRPATAAAILTTTGHMNRDTLLDVLQRTRQWLARPDNNFLWSSWKDADDALREIDALIGAFGSATGPDPGQIKVLFAPTGPIQDVSVNSGWGDRFLELSEAVDAALED